MFMKLRLRPYLLVLAHVLVLGLSTACDKREEFGASEARATTGDQSTFALTTSDPAVPNNLVNLPRQKAVQQEAFIDNLPPEIFAFICRSLSWKDAYHLLSTCKLFYNEKLEMSLV
jgi:hypothetical protein